MTSNLDAKQLGVAAPKARYIVRLLALPLALPLAIVHVLWRDPIYTFNAGLCCGALAALALITVSRAAPGRLPSLPFMMFYYYLSMGSAVFVPIVIWGFNSRRLRVSSAGVEEAALGVLVFACVALLPYRPIARLTERVIGLRIAQKLDIRDYGPEDTLIVRGVALLALFFSAVITAKSGGLSLPFGSLTYPVMLISSPALSLGLLAWDAHVTQSRMAWYVFWAAVLANCFLGLLTGMLGSAALPVATAVILTWTFGYRPPIFILAAALLVFVTLNIAKHTYRSMTWRNGEYVSLVERVENWGRAIDETYGGRAAPTMRDNADSTAARVRTFAQVAQMFDWVPTRISHAGIEQWLELPLDYVPRVLWPEKESHVLRWNSRYTFTFALQSKLIHSPTAITLPAVGDGYWRLGWLGVVLEGLLFGSLCGLYAGMACHSSRARTIFGASFLLSHTVDQHVFATLSGLPQQTIALVAVFIALRMASHVFKVARKAAASRIDPELPVS